MTIGERKIERSYEYSGPHAKPLYIFEDHNFCNIWNAICYSFTLSSITFEMILIVFSAIFFKPFLAHLS
jgi:hypothetical protein